MTVTVKWYGDKVKTAVMRGSTTALWAAGGHLLEVANKTVPEDGKRTLERSGKVTVWGSAYQAKVSYNTPYAKRQHEDMTFKHLPGRRAKWLQRALTEEAQRIHMIVATVMRGAFR